MDAKIFISLKQEALDFITINRHSLSLIMIRRGLSFSLKGSPL